MIKRTKIKMENKEIEVRFLEIDKDKLITKLNKLGAVDKGEKMLEETIIYDADETWSAKDRFIRIRKDGEKTKLTYKQHGDPIPGSSTEIEFSIDDAKKAEQFLHEIGFFAYRRQQKKRHSFELKGVIIDIDTWPRVPAYVELEGVSKEALKEAAESLGFDWKDADMHDAAWVLENRYNIPVKTMRWFTFDRFE